MAQQRQYRWLYTENGVLYYQIPVQVFRGALLHPRQTFEDVICIINTDFETCNERNRAAGMLGGVNGFETDKEKGSQMLEYSIRNHNVKFSIKSSEYWKYNIAARNDELNKRDLLLWLCWLALHTIGGNSEIRSTTNATMFLRAAGFINFKDWDDYNSQDETEIKRLYHLPDKTSRIISHRKGATAKDKSKDRMKQPALRVRNELMNRYTNFHCYSRPAMRGWLYMFADMDRNEAMLKMAQYKNWQQDTRREQQNEYRAMMNKATEEAKHATQ